MTESIDIQKKLDEKLASSPEAQKYVSKLWYIPGVAPPPSDVTHIIELSSALSPERHIRIGLVTVPAFGIVLESLLALIATNPTGGIQAKSTHLEGRSTKHRS